MARCSCRRVPAATARPRGLPAAGRPATIVTSNQIGIEIGWHRRQWRQGRRILSFWDGRDGGNGGKGGTVNVTNGTDITVVDGDAGDPQNQDKYGLRL
jgi:hypothetical protein